MNTPAEQQWIEIRNENGQLYYFNKIVRSLIGDLGQTGITVQDKPIALKQAEESANNFSHSFNVKHHGDSLTGNGSAGGK